MRIAQICADHLLSVHSIIPGVCAVAPFIICEFHFCTVIYRTDGRPFIGSIILLGNTLSIFVILKFDRHTSDIIAGDWLSCCIIIASFHPISVFINISVGSITAFLVYGRMSIDICIAACQRISTVIICKFGMRIAQILADHWYPVQPDIPDLCVVPFFVLFKLFSCTEIFCAYDGLFVCSIIVFCSTLAIIIIL